MMCYIHGNTHYPMYCTWLANGTLLYDVQQGRHNSGVADVRRACSCVSHSKSKFTLGGISGISNLSPARQPMHFYVSREKSTRLSYSAPI
jgi:hypothetical protein